jgi:general secretion pathway protein D
MRIIRKLMAVLTAFLLATQCLVACVQNPIAQKANEQIKQGDRQGANASLKQATQLEPTNLQLLGQSIQNKNLWLSSLWTQLDTALIEKDFVQAKKVLEKIITEDPRNPRVAAARSLIETGTKNAVVPTAAVNAILGSNLQQDATTIANASLAKRIASIEFREAPLRSVLEALSKLGAISYVFDKEVKTDSKISISLRNVSADEALKVILISQQLDSKKLSESSVLIFPQTAPKIRDYVELQSRSFFLNNFEAKQAQALIKALVKSRDTFIDEKLNLLVIKDTPAAIAYAERLIESVDYPEPEVVLDVLVMELARTKSQDLGLRYPESLQLGLPSVQGSVVTRNNWRDQIVSTASPSIVAALRNFLTDSNLLSNPNIRVKNREKARIHIGEKLPVFTSSFTTGTGASGAAANAFATQISFLEVGLKLDVEAQVFLQNEVTIKLALEVSNVIAKIKGPADSVGYQIGTRNTATTLRLRDGETQIFAGLIRDDDRKTINGLPVASELPVLGRLFGGHTSDTDRTEIILMITPRIIRNIDPSQASLQKIVAGTDASVGAQVLQLSTRASAAVAGPTGRAQGVVNRGAPVADSVPSAVEATANAGQQIDLRFEGPQAASIGSEFDIQLMASGPAVGNDVVVELGLSGDAFSASDGNRSTILVTLTGEQTNIRLKPIAADKLGSISIVSVRNARGALSVGNPSAGFSVRVVSQ